MLRSTRHTVVATAAGLLVAVSALASPHAAAHDSVIGGNPDNGEVVETFPETISLEFSGYVKEDFNTFAVSDAETQEVLFSGEPHVDERVVSLEVPSDVDPGPGDYRIGFQITSSDGHATRGMTTFTVAGGPEEQEQPAEGSAQSDSGADTEASAQETTQEASSAPWGWIIGAGLAVLLIVGAIVAVAGKRR